MKLIIAEKASLSRNIANAIGIIKKENGFIICKDEYIVTHCIGHLLEIRQPKKYNENFNKKWSEYNLPFIPSEFIYEVKEDEGIKQQLEIIKSLMLKANLIIHCGDADREGQIIVDNVLKYNKKNLPVKRLWLPEQTENTILKSLNNLEDNSNFYNLSQEGYARAYMDYLLGHNITIVLTNLTGKLLNTGRVIVPIVKYIYDRDKEIKNFKVEKYYSVENEKNIKLVCKTKFKTIEEASEYAKNLNLNKGKVNNIESKDIIKYSKKLFSLSELQTEISKKFKMNFATSLKIIQDLYEKGYLTYPRTNTEYLAENEKDKVQDILKVLDNTDLIFKDSKKIFDNTKIESHSAITITTKIPEELTEDEQKVYNTVYNRFLSNFTKEDCIITETTMNINVGNEEFEIKGSVIKQLGFMKYEPKEVKDNLPDLKINDIFDVEFKAVEKETTPPAKINEGKLSKFLKNPFKKDDEITEDERYKDILDGIEIGTEATRTGIIEKCIKIGYLTLDKGIFNITELGIYFIEQLLKYDINLFKEKSVEFSKLQKKIYKNELKIDDLLLKLKEELDEIVQKTKDIKSPEKYLKKELKDGEVIEIKSPKGIFYKGKFLNEERIIAANSKYFNNELKITKDIATKLFAGKSVSFVIKDKAGKEYKQRLKLTLNGQYLNFIKEK